MSPGELIDFLSELFDVPRPTVDLRARSVRAAGLLTSKGRGPRSAAEMVEGDAINLALATAFNFDRGVDVGAVVHRIRSMPLLMAVRHHPESQRTGADAVGAAREAAHFLRGLSVLGSQDAGEALDSVVRDLRSGRFEMWANGKAVDIVFDFHSPRSLAMLSLDRWEDKDSAAISFGDETPEDPLTETIFRINDGVFRALAKALGRIETNEARSS